MANLHFQLSWYNQLLEQTEKNPSDKKLLNEPLRHQSTLTSTSASKDKRSNPQKRSQVARARRAQYKVFFNGLSAEFYKCFWSEISTDIICSFNYAFKTGMLSINQRRGIISLIPKKNKDKSLLENLRPISLLNIDYKILTKSIAKRLENILSKIINPNQTGYIKGRRECSANSRRYVSH